VPLGRPPDDAGEGGPELVGAGGEQADATIAPGTFDTPILARLPQNVRDSLGQMTPHPRPLGRPDEFARMALAIIDNPMVNGETIRLDGAIRRQPK